MSREKSRCKLIRNPRNPKRQRTISRWTSLINLPAYGYARVCANHDYFEGIAEYEGLGIAPDLEVNYEIKNL